MITLIFIIFMFLIFGNILKVAIKMAWGVTKVLFSLVFLPVFLIVLVLVGLIKFALPILAIVGLISIVSLSWD